jgi:hypothetical protein
MTASYNLCLKIKHQIFTVRIVSSYTSEFLIADFAEQNIRRDLEISAACSLGLIWLAKSTAGWFFFREKRCWLAG